MVFSNLSFVDSTVFVVVVGGKSDDFRGMLHRLRGDERPCLWL